VYGPRAKQPGKLDPFQGYLEERMQAGVWNARVLLRELRERSYTGGYTLPTDWLRPQREAARTVAVRRFETPPGKQAQVDWGHLGTVRLNGEERKLWGFAFTLGYSRTMMAEAALGSNAGYAAANARGSLPAVGRRTGGGPLRPHENRVAGDRRARLDGLEPGVPGLRALLGLHAAAMQALSGNRPRARSNPA
jgi:hypothetical protein